MPKTVKKGCVYGKLREFWQEKVEPVITILVPVDRWKNEGGWGLGIKSVGGNFGILPNEGKMESKTRCL